MRARILALLAFAILFSSIVYAGTCTDSDGGPIDPAKPTKFIGIKGYVDYGTGPKPDYCVSRLGGTLVAESNWIRENYCDGDSITAKDYLCGDYSYDSCMDGVCINYTGTQAALDDVGTPPNRTEEAIKNCGNKKLDGKEECDPPNKVCMPAGGGMGLCTSDCRCEKYQTKNQTANQTNQTLQINTSNASSNTSQAANETSAGQVTFEVDASAAQEVSDTESESSSEEKTGAASTPTGALPADIQDIMDSTDKEIEELSNRPGVRISATITSFVMKIWSLFSGLFGW